ncbi:Protein CBG28054 [Caenorhabditis briggsae]|uniref:Protein CBG28054 n=1 Tax=Caenorhabditis briggsae TaxID=6238 RepID=B6IGP4_CAEBR|nr:Protein CBG28054 [Caenorhabditis briggsae]CAR99074.1 Protein CBG28054 [Caenorhabditis briggsae]
MPLRNPDLNWKSLDKIEKQHWKDCMKNLAATRDEQVKFGLIRILQKKTIAGQIHLPVSSRFLCQPGKILMVAPI